MVLLSITLNDYLDIACNALQLNCFEDAIEKGTQDLDLGKGCYKACKRIMYGLSAASDLPMTETLLNFESYGKEFAKYFLQPSKLFDYLGQHYNRDGFLKPKMESMSLIYINFDGPEVLTVTKDAKITLPDMIGNIGGTLGVFIGFSFLGFLDTLIEIFQYVRKKIKKNHSLKIKQSKTLTL